MLSEQQVLGVVGLERPEKIALGRGQLEFEWRVPEVHGLRCAGVPSAVAIMARVRDRNWATVPGQVTRKDLQLTAKKAICRFACTHDDGAIGFQWSGELRAEVADTRNCRVIFRMSGQALRSFLANRVGLCLLHPLELAGVPATVASASGASEGVFPGAVAPWQPFSGFTRMRYTFSGAQFDIAFEGELFETEDQRNWSDASYKTYCPPLEGRLPRSFAAGETVTQSITLNVTHEPVKPRTLKRRRDRMTLDTSDPKLATLPSLGVAAGTLSLPVPDSALDDALRQLAPAHLHTVLDPAQPAWAENLQGSAALAAALGARIQCEVVVDGAEPLYMVAGELEKVLAGRRSLLGRVMLFDRATSVTPEELVVGWRAAARQRDLTEKVVGGSRANFAELNRASTPYALLSGVTFGICPQVHSFSNAEITHTLRSHELLARQALAMSRAEDLHVGPVTLLPRFDAATANAGTVGNGGPDTSEGASAAGDPRQISLWAASWTLASISALARGGAHALTYFELLGQRGVMGYVEPGPARPLARYPVYEVLRALGSMIGAPLLRAYTSTDSPLAVLALESKNGPVVMVSNLSSVQVEFGIEVPGLTFESHILDAGVADAMLAGRPYALRFDRDIGQSVSLGPYEVAVLHACAS